MYPFFFWGRQIIQLVCAFGGIICFFAQFIGRDNYLNKMFNTFNISNILLALILFFLHWHFFKIISVYVNIFGIFANVIMWFIPILLFCLSTDEEKSQFIIFFTNLMGMLLLVSLSAYLLVLIGVDIPHSKIYYPENTFYEYFDNYNFFIVVHDTRNFSIFARFQSVFTEPGHLSMMVALLLYANEYKFKKWQNIVLFLSLIFTLSLAGYLLFIAGIFLHRFSRSNKKVLMFIVLCIVALIFLGITFTYYTKYPDSFISKTIISRLVPDKQKGFAGNNRTSNRFKSAYKDFINEGSIRTITGFGNSMNNDFPNGGNASYKNFVYEYGIIGFFLLGIMYISFMLGIKSFLPVGLLILYMLSFWQRPYATWLSQIFIFISYCSKYYSNNITKIVNSHGRVKKLSL